MKQSKEYAKRLKKLYQTLVRKHGKLKPDEPSNAITQLLEGILSDCTTQLKGRAALEKVLSMMVDLNELRVTPPMELEHLIDKQVPLARQKSQQISEALNDIRKRQEDLDLDFLKDRGRREAREYLESLAGVSKAVAAKVMLFSLGGHAIPVDDLTLYILRKDEVVEETASADEVQGFLERQISAAEGPTFALLLEKHVTAKSSRVPIEKLDELLNPPPPEPEPKPTKKKTKADAQDEEPAAPTTEKKKAASASKAKKKSSASASTASDKKKTAKPASKGAKPAARKTTKSAGKASKKVKKKTAAKAVKKTTKKKTKKKKKTSK